MLTTVLSENFESAFPATNGWTLSTNTADYAWGSTTYKAHAGTHSAFGSQFQSINTSSTYPDNLDTTMSKTVDLSAYGTASLSFWDWENTENNYDFLRVVVNGTEVFSTSTDPAAWTQNTVNLDAYAGQSGVVVSFEFASDSSNNNAPDGGVWLDDILLTAGTVVAPTIAVTTPNGGENWQVGTTHSVNWTVSGDASNVASQLVLLSTDGGASFTAISGALSPADRSFSFTPDSSQISTTAIVKVQELNASSTPIAQDASNANFTISGVITGTHLTITPTFDSSITNDQHHQ